MTKELQKQRQKQTYQKPQLYAVSLEPAGSQRNCCGMFHSCGPINKSSRS